MAMAGGRSADVGQGRAQVGRVGEVGEGLWSGVRWARCKVVSFWSGKEQDEAEGSRFGA